jgi:hypothetical protein
MNPVLAMKTKIVPTLASIFCAACSCKPFPAAHEQSRRASEAAAGSVSLQFYERRPAEDGKVLVPPILLRLSGTLQQKDGCLIVANGNGDHALVFENGRAAYDATKKALIIGSASFAVGDDISLGGPFNQPADGYDPAFVKKRCGVDAVWLVTGADVRRRA